MTSHGAARGQGTRQRCRSRIGAAALLWLAAAWPAPALAQEADSGATLRERLAARKAAKASDSAPAAAANAPITGPGNYSFTLVHGGLTRAYRVHVPRSYDAQRPTALVVSFHGGGGNMDYQADDQYYGLISKSESSGSIVVFPNGYSPFKSGKLASWNAGNCCAGARDKNIDDVGFIREMLGSLRSRLNIDPQRIFANGMSNGAMFSHRLACEMSDTFQAIASVAGSDGTKVCAPGSPVSILQIHARDDEVVLFNGGSGKDKAYLADFVSVPETVARWVRRNACNVRPQRVLDKPGASCDAYTGCRGNVEVRLCVTESGGHSWPGGTKVRTGEKGSTAISATDLMWEFFERR